MEGGRSRTSDKPSQASISRDSRQGRKWGFVDDDSLVLTTKNIHFVKLSKCVTDFTIVFFLSRWSKNIYGTSNLGSRWGSYASEKISVWGPELPVCTSDPRPELPVGTGTSGGWRRKAHFCAKINYRYFRFETGTSSEAWPELPVGVYSESNSKISNRSVSRSILGREKLRK
jgi:hypothetical protein